MANTEQTVQNMMAHGLYKADRVAAFAMDKAKSIEPSVAQVKYRDDLYKFIVEKGVARDNFKLGRTKQMISKDIRSFWTIISKHRLEDEWNRRANDG